MSIDGLKASGGSAAVVKPLNHTGKTLEHKKLELKKATRQFESYFILHMLKAMRQAIPKSDFLSGGLGEDLYTSLFDEELAQKMSGISPGSISSVLYKSLERRLEAVEKPPSISEGDTPRPLRPEDRTGAKAVDYALEPARRPAIQSDPVLQHYGPYIEEAARKHDVSARLIHAVIMTESGGRADAISPKGAKGLMQLMDGTAAELGVTDSLNARQNIHGGTRYLRQLLDKYDGNLSTALAAYNAGPGTVDRFGGMPPYAETRQYVDHILSRLKAR